MKYGMQAGFAVKAAAVVAVVAGVATAGFDIKESKATLTAPTGKCGFLINVNPTGLNQNIGSSAKTVTTIGVMDFDAGTSNYIDTKVTNWGTTSASVSSVAAQNTFTLRQGSIAGQYIATMGTQEWNLMSSNSGNTYLIQSVADATHTGVQYVGVCQAL